jgi:hypothetical protein
VDSMCPGVFLLCGQVLLVLQLTITLYGFGDAYFAYPHRILNFYYHVDSLYWDYNAIFRNMY